MKYLVVGLGNPGIEYSETRHNVGFAILDELASKRDVVFSSERYAQIGSFKTRGKTLILIKPQTFMNLSGKAVRYWMNEAKVPIERVFVLTDDLALPLGTIRIRKKGSSGGHNGLQNIEELLGRSDYPRLRFGIGNEFKKGGQVDFVLSEFTEEEKPSLKNSVERAVAAVLDLPHLDMSRLMNQYNN